MINRLRNFLRATSLGIGFCLLFLPTDWLLAQPDFFNFSYNGPTTLPVGPTCSSMLQGNVPDPVVSSTVGANITMSMFDPVASGFQYDDLFTVGGVAPVHWFVKDDAGHSHIFEYFINFVDVSPPTFNLTGVFDTLEFSSSVQVPVQTALPVTDNCTMIVSDTFYQTTPPDTCASGTFTRTWMATDAHSNTAVFTQTIIIYKDSLPPQITGYPLSGSAPCEQLATAYPNWLAAQIATFAATDASGIKSLSNNAPASFPPGCKVPLPVRFKAVDNCMFQLNVDVTFSTSDLQGPTVVKPPKDTVAYCSQSDQELVKLREWINKKAFAEATDNCSPPLSYSMKIAGNTVDSAQVVSAFLASFANGCSTQMVGNQSYNKVHGLVSVDFFVKDACGNETFMGNADFGAIDTLPPVITGLNATEQCGGGNDQNALQAWINAHGNATVVEDCSNFTWTNYSFVTSTGQAGDGIFNLGPYPTIQPNNCAWFVNVTFRATDDCGNSSTRTLRWSIIDTQAPTFTGLQPNITVFCPNPLPTVPAATVADNCDANIAITFARVYQDSLCDGSYTVFTTWTATDDCGNSATATQHIFVRDTTRPVFSLLPADQTFRCDTFVLPPVPVMGINIAASDVCSPVVSITTVTNSFQNADPALCGHYTYNIVRTFTATDECGNTRTASQTISVVDNLGPAPGGILDTTALCSALDPFPAPVPLATDACSGPTAVPTFVDQTITPGTCAGAYTIALHWIAEDVCGNKTPFDQLVHVIDTVAPTLLNLPANITVECDAIPAPPETSSFSPADQCDTLVNVVLVETELRNPDTTSCEHWTDYILQREWTATDLCGNSRTYTQLIQIEDTTPPALVPPMAMTFPNDPDDCGAEIMIPAPLSVTDVCSQQLTSTTIMDMKPLVASGPGSPFITPVASMSFQLIPPNQIPFKPVIGIPVLKVILDNADAEGPTEDFRIFDENNVLLGTAYTDSQCKDKTVQFPLNANLLNTWFANGVASFTAVPNGSGANACNPICAGGKMTLQLEYMYSGSPVPIALTYTVDGGAPQNYPPAAPTFLSTGSHTVIYTATDCAGNSSSASVQITINDTQPPTVVAPANITAFTGVNNCEGTVTLPFPVITENCAMSVSLSLSSPLLPIQFENDPNVGVVASDVSLNLTGLIPNAVGNGRLKIKFKGDNAQVGEFFNVYDESGNLLGFTGQGTLADECSVIFETVIPVTAAQINTWASMGGGFGSTFFYLESNRDLLNYTEFIGNCAPLLPNGTDGVSQIQIMLEYSHAVVNFTIHKPVNQLVASGTITGNSTTVALPPANYTVTYTTTDNAGLTGSATFAITVRDTVKPKAICQPTLIIQVDPSGAAPYLLSPANINNGSFDNCTPTANLTYSVSPGTFNCNLAGSTVLTTLTVTDTSGNSATCKTLVGVTTTPPDPDYTPVCENYTLGLIANPPSTSPYTYQWNGPNNYFSNQQNPIVTTNAMAIHNGTYCVTITGATGCTSSACVVVNLAILGNPPFLVSNGASYCPGQNIVLSTTSYNGQNVSYQWIVDSPSGLVVLGTSSTTTYTISNLAPGTYTYYLKVFADGCNTALSNPVTVTMHPTPPAAVDPSLVKKCEGETISLHSTTPSTGGLTYMWMGPGGFTSNAPSPLVTNSAVKSIHEGVYTLITKQNGCSSNPVTVTVNITAKPVKPSLSGNLNACAGQTVTLVCSSLNGEQYLWSIPTANGILDTTTTGNTLQIVNVSLANTGSCSVIVAANGCYSDASNPVLLRVHDYPIVTASSNAPICKDSLLQLMATFASAVPLTWCWNFPDASQYFVQNLTVPNGASGVYQVIGKTSFGCADTATVTVNNVTPPSITIIGNNAPACCDGTTDAMLTSLVTSPNTPFTYLWTGPPAFGTSTLANPVIPDVCTPYNGQYTLVVKDSFGCPSQPATTEINIQDPPATPMLVVNPPQPVCAGANILLTISNPTPGATYFWDRPGLLADTTTVSASLEINNAQAWHSGVYLVTAISGNGTCQSGASNSITVTIHPIPDIPAITAVSPVCEGGILSLQTTAVLGAVYFWTGPLGFSSSLQNPTRSPVTLGMEGEYKLRIELNGCSSGQASVLVDVIPTPQTPLISQPPAQVCIDLLPLGQFLNIINPVNGMLYTWQDAASGIVLAGPSTASQLNLDSVLLLGPGSHTFRVFSTSPLLSGCNSLFSNVVTISFDTIPEGVNAFAGVDRFACSDAPIPLNATAPSGTVTGWWTQTGGPAVTIVNANLTNATFEGDPNNVYTFVWSLSNGACMNFSSDIVQITAQEREFAQGGPDTVYCSPLGIELQATQGASAQGQWTQMPSQAQLGIVIDDPNDPNTSISGNLFNGMTYAFFWEIGNLGCGSSIDPVEIYIFSPKPNAGPVQFVCDNQNCTDLGASSLASFEVGQWSSHDPALTFTNPSSPNTTVCGLKPGNNVIFWTINQGICGSQSRDTVEVFYELFPTAVNDVVSVSFGGSAQFNVLQNDILPNSFSLTILTPPTPGTIIETLGNGVFVYRPQSGFTGTDASMTYSVCNTNCPSSCSIATVSFHIGGAPDCFIPTIITPNGDGFNDEFKIPDQCTLGEGAEFLDVAIFNQWGDLVFQAKPYRNDWGGTYNNEELPAGTYYYVVKLNENDKPLTGFLLIQR